MNPDFKTNRPDLVPTPSARVIYRRRFLLQVQGIALHRAFIHRSSSFEALGDLPLYQIGPRYVQLDRRLRNGAHGTALLYDDTKVDIGV